MKSKLMFAALAITFGATFVAHADEYRRPRPPQPQPQERPQQYDEEDLDDVRRPSRDCEDECERPRRRVEYYCNTDCRRPEPPEVLPYPPQRPPVAYPMPMPVPVPVPGPIYQPIPAPMPLPYFGPCTRQPRAWGWAIVNSQGVEVARGSRYDAAQIPFVSQQLLANRICSAIL